MALYIPEYLQTQTYSAQRLRNANKDLPVQEGVVNTGDLGVFQRGAGANMSVDVEYGHAWVKGDSIANQGLYHIYGDKLTNVVFNAAHATLPRIDQVGLRVFDSTDAADGTDTPAFVYLPGTATSGATLTSRIGAAALPNTTLRLADVLVPAASTSVVNANIRDRRSWAQGARYYMEGSRAGSYSTASKPFVAIDTTNLQVRLECTGAVLRIVASLPELESAAGSVTVLVDGVQPSLMPQQINADKHVTISGFYVPTAGSRLFSLAWSVGSGLILATNTSHITPTLIIEEMLSPLGYNGLE